MSNRIKILILSLSVAILSVFISAYIKAPAASKTKTEKNEEIYYVLKEYNGMLAIYKSNQNTPIEILDVSISSLPERDADKIKDGIISYSLNEMISIVEDYE